MVYLGLNLNCIQIHYLNPIVHFICYVIVSGNEVIVVYDNKSFDTYYFNHILRFVYFDNCNCYFIVSNDYYSHIY